MLIRRYFQEVLQRKIHPGWLQTVVVIYALAAMKFAYSHWEAIELTTLPAHQQMMAVSISVWFASLFLMLLGYTHLPIRIISFLAFNYFMRQGYDYYVINIEGKFCTMLSFWLLFFDFSAARQSLLNHTPEDRSQWPAAWPAYLLGWNLAFMLFIGGGLSKVTDPFWLDGSGFYYTMQMPYLHNSLIDWLMASEFVMLAVNHISLVVELMFIFIYPIRRLRPLTAAYLIGFVVVLNLLQVQAIGYFGIAILALILLDLYADRVGHTGVSKALWRFWHSYYSRLQKALKPLWAPWQPLFQPRLQRLGFWSIGAMMSFIFILHLSSAAIMGFSAFHASYISFYDQQTGEEVFKDKPRNNTRLLRTLEEIKYQMSRFNMRSFSLYYTHLFTNVHFYGVYIPTVECELPDGERYLSPSFCKPDATGGEQYLGWITSSRIEQALIYQVCRNVRTHQQLLKQQAPRSQFDFDKMIPQMLRYATIECKENTGQAPKRVNMRVKFMALDGQGYGTPTDWQQKPWVPYLGYNPQSGEIELVDIPDFNPNPVELNRVGVTARLTLD